LAEVERVALGQSEHSRILAACQVQENSEHAHRFLVRCGYWPGQYNPWASRLGANLNPVDFQIPDIVQDERTDLTHLEAYAIDDIGNQDPDDAISVDGNRLWVHVADVAALISPDSEIDRAACSRGSNLYLPEGVITMLPEEVTRKLGLGLSEESPALSFGFCFIGGEISDIEIIPSRVRVIRTSYDEVEQQLDDFPFSKIRQTTEAFHAKRLDQGAAEIRLPEVNIKLEDGKVVIRPMTSLHSRQMVTNAMLMTGVAATSYAQAHDITIPYAIQPSPEEIRQPKTMSEMYAYRRLFKPSSAVPQPDRHFGLGLDAYARTTSPLRRYLDLLTHQQLRATTLGSTPLSQEQVSERIWTCETAIRTVRRAERLSNLHWKLVYLKQNPKWQGEAVIVSVEEHKAVAIIPELALETKIRRNDRMQLDTRLRLSVRDVNLFDQTAYFRVLS
jgi:exoribonuclease-2